MKLVAVLVLALAAAVAIAKDATPTDLDPVAQARAVGLAAELRCLVCQNQSIAESNADLAVDLRRQIREQINAGRSDAQIVDYMVARYGEFVLYRPPLTATTILLWAGPALLGILGLAWLGVTLRSRARLAEAPPLSDEERRQASALLARDPR